MKLKDLHRCVVFYFLCILFLSYNTICTAQNSKDMKKMINDFPVELLEDLIQPVDPVEYKLLLKRDSTINWTLAAHEADKVTIQNKRSPDNVLTFRRYKTSDEKWIVGVQQVDAQNQKTDLWINSTKNGWQVYPMPKWTMKDFVFEQVELPVKLNVAVRPYLSVELGDMIQFKINTYTFSQEVANHFQVDAAKLEHTYIKYKYVLGGDSLTMEKKQDEDFTPLYSDLATVEVENPDGPGIDEFNCPHGVSVISSSVLAPQSTFSYKANNLLDRNETTAWSEGVKGNGIGEWIEFTIIEHFFIGESYQIINGYGKDKNSWRNNGRVKGMKCFVNGKLVAYITLQDEMEAQSFTINPIWFKSFQLQKGDKIRFVIEEVYKGLKYEDTLITQFVPTGNCG